MKIFLNAKVSFRVKRFRGQLYIYITVGTHLRVLSESYPMNTNKTVEMVFKKMCVLVFCMRVASALEGLTLNEGYFILSFLVKERLS